MHVKTSSKDGDDRYDRFCSFRNADFHETVLQFGLSALGIYRNSDGNLPAKLPISALDAQIIGDAAVGRALAFDS